MLCVLLKLVIKKVKQKSIMNERKIGILISYINIVLHAVIGFIYVPLLLHYIGKSEYGLYQLIGSFIAYFSIMDFGLADTIVRFYANFKAVKDKTSMENILAIAVRAYAVIAVMLLVAGYIFYINIEVVFVSSMSQTEISIAKKLFLLLLFNIVITFSTMIFRAVINANEKFLFLKGTETLQMVLQPVFVILVLQQYPSAVAIAIVQTTLNISLIIARCYYCFFKLKIKIKFHYFDKRLISDMKKLALSVFIVVLIDQVFLKTNQVILGMVSGTIAVAIYSIASLIYMNYMALSTAISGVYLPHVTEIVAKNEPVKKLSDLFIKIGRYQYYLLALVASGFIIFGRDFINIWAGRDFEEAYWITLLIIIPFTIDLIQNIGLSIMQAQNRYDFRAKVYFIMGLFNLCLAIPLAKLYGGIGCAFATGLSMFLGNGLIMNWYYLKVTKLDIFRFWKEICKISICVVCLTLVGYVLYNYYNVNNVAEFIIGIVTYTVIYSLVVYKLCMNLSEREKVQKIFQKIVNII